MASPVGWLSGDDGSSLLLQRLCDAETTSLPSEPFVLSALAPHTSSIRAKCYMKSMCTAWIPSLWLGAKVPVRFLAFHTSHFRTFPPQHQSPLVSVAQAVVASLIGTRP